MGLGTSALQIGRSAIQASQAALQVVGNNIANAGNADYARQTPGLSAIPGQSLPGGLQPGAGVALTEIKRHFDEAIETRLRASIGENESAQVQQLNLGRVETLFNDVGGAGLASRLTEFFNSFSDVQNDPADRGIRDVTIAKAEGLANALRQLRAELTNIGNDANAQIKVHVVEADRLAANIADLNARIVAAEGGGSRGTANALRDQRDAALRDLSELVDVTARTQSDGTMNVYFGSEPLILGGQSRGLTTQTSSDGEFTRVSIRFADSNTQVQPRSGKLAGLIKSREVYAFARIESVDALARALIYEVNRVHADGQGLDGLTSVTGTYAVDDPTAVLSDAGLPFTPANGSFFISVTNEASGEVKAYQIDVDLDGVGDDTSLQSLTDAINATDSGVTAAITAGNKLSLTAEAGLSFSFGHDNERARGDTAGILAALGINTFFDGNGAGDIAVQADLLADPGRLAAAEVNFDGDGNNAGRLAGLADHPSALLNGASITAGYQEIATDVAVTSAAATDAVDASGAIRTAIQSQKESISGVSLDEEAINLLKFERAFQGAARYVSTVDRLLTELMAILR